MLRAAWLQFSTGVSSAGQDHRTHATYRQMALSALTGPPQATRRLTSRAIWSAPVRRRAPRTPGGALAPFRERPEHELVELGDENLVAYIVRAREEGRTEPAVTAAQILAWRHEERVRGFVYTRIGDLGQAVCDEIIELTIAGAIRSAERFKGESLGEFRAIVFTIARRRIDDHHRKQYRDGTRTRETPLDREPEGDDGPKRELGGSDPAEERIDGLLREGVFKQAYAALNPVHQRVVALRKFRDLPHREIAERVNSHFGDELDDPMTEQNVNQINSRFDRELDRLLAKAEDLPDADHEDD